MATPFLPGPQGPHPPDRGCTRCVDLFADDDPPQADDPIAPNARAHRLAGIAWVEHREGFDAFYPWKAEPRPRRGLQAWLDRSDDGRRYHYSGRL